MLICLGCQHLSSDWGKANKTDTARAYGEFLENHPELQSGGSDRHATFLHEAQRLLALREVQERKIRAVTLECKKYTALTPQHRDAVVDCLRSANLWTEDEGGLTLHVEIRDEPLQMVVRNIPSGGELGDVWGAANKEAGSPSTFQYLTGGLWCGLWLKGSRWETDPLLLQDPDLSNKIKALYESWKRGS